MSERLEPQEGLPKMRLGLSGGEFEATPENSHLYTFMGRLAMYNHIFLVTSEGEGTISGTYLFNQIHTSQEVFDELSDFMIANDYHTDLNRREVPDCDVKAYDDTVVGMTEDLGDTIPEGWE